jgi:hypothetical protein
MARFEGLASIRRALSMPNGGAQLDIKPDGLDWQWTQVPADRARQGLACALAAIDGRWKMYVSLPDDPNSISLEIVGLSNTPDQREPVVLDHGGDRTTKVPDVMGMSRAEADEAITAAELKPGFSGATGNRRATVSMQTPVAGRDVAKTSGVNMFLSVPQGPTP